MDCCGDDSSPNARDVGVVENRKCRDVIFLILFALFWVGMFIICGIATNEGDVNRLMYGLDSYGFLCGSENKYRNITVDLKEEKSLYYLNPLELVDPANYMYAKSICVKKCPGPEDRCDPTSLPSRPCTKNNQYRCPYYLMAANSLYRTLNSGVTTLNTAYFNSLASTRIKTCNTSLPAGLTPSLLTTYLKPKNKTTASACGMYYQLSSQLNKGPCYPVWVSTASFMYRCFPDTSIDQLIDAAVKTGGKVASKAQEGKDIVKRIAYTRQKSTQYLGDLRRGYEVLALAGILGGLVLALLWIVLLRYAVAPMVWFTLIAINLLLFGIMLFSFDKAGYLTKNGAVGNFLDDVVPDSLNPAGDYQRVWLIIAAVMTVVFVIVFLFTLVMIKRIAIAIATIKSASKCVAKMPSLLAYPLLPFVFNVGLILYWVYITALLWSAGDKLPTFRGTNQSSALSIAQLYNAVYNTSAPATAAPPAAVRPNPATNLTLQEQIDRCPMDPNCYFSYQWNDKLRYTFAYHVFGLLWTHQFIVSATYITLAGAVGMYYWTGGEPPVLAVLAALKNTTFFHLGSAAFGGAIIAVLQFLRLLLEYFHRSAQKTGGDNWIVRWLFCCAQCVLWCVQKIMEFINKNAFILIGVKGYGYCQAAGAAVKLIIGNALRLTTVDIIADIMIFLGKLSVAAGSALMAFVICNSDRYNDRTNNPKTYISTPLLLVVFSALIGYIVADVFLSVYEIAIETIILSFCEDCDANGGKPKFAPPELLAALHMKPRKPLTPPPVQKDPESPVYHNPVHNHQTPPPSNGYTHEPPYSPDQPYDTHAYRSEYADDQESDVASSRARTPPPARGPSPLRDWMKFRASNPDGAPKAHRASDIKKQMSRGKGGGRER